MVQLVGFVKSLVTGEQADQGENVKLGDARPGRTLSR
jgi:hypothetical protein